MKNIVITIALLLTFSRIANSQNPNWITPGQLYLKMYIVDDDIFRINKADFTNAGISTNSIDPRTVKVYYKGNQIPIFFNGESDGVFNDSDYFDFWGQRNYGGVTNVYNENNTVQYTKDEYYDTYSDTSVYWIGWGGSFGIRYTNNSYSVSTLYPLNYFYNRVHLEQDVYYTLGEWNGNDNDYRCFLNDKFLGEGWFWKVFGNLNTLTIAFRTPYLPSSSATCRFKVFAYPINYSPTVQNEHRLRVSINNVLLDTLKRNDFNRFDTTITFPSSILNQTSNSLVLKSTPPSSFTDSQIDYDMAEIFYSSRFQFDSNKFIFKSDLTDTNSKLFTVKGFNAANETKIYDVINNEMIINQYSSNDTLFFTGKGNGKFYIINKSNSKKPFRIKQKSVPNIVTNSIGVDYLVIYHKLFETQAEQLRAYRQSHDNFRSYKAEIEDIYDVYNFGMESPEALKSFMFQIWNNWTLPKVKYLCLFGRGSLDSKKRLSSSSYYQNFIPVYGNPPSDGYFANMRPGSFTYSQDISVGRIPVITQTEAQEVVAKIISYESQQIDEWIKSSIFISGGMDKNDQPVFAQNTNNLINSNISNSPLSMIPYKIYLTDTSGLVTYNMSDSIVRTFRIGGLIADYSGHAGNGYWDYSFTDPSILDNGNKNPLIISNTCFTGKNAEADNRGYAELFYKYANKGAIGFIGSTGWGFSGSGLTYNDYILKAISTDSIRRIGDILKKASIRMAPDSTNSFPARNTIACFNLGGDPASKLLLPVIPEFVINSEGYSVSESNPQLNDNILISISPKNIGTNADSCKVRLQLFKNQILIKQNDTVLKNFGFKKSLTYPVSFDSIGNYVLKVTLDADNWYPLEQKSNNVLNIHLSLLNSSFLQLKPFDKEVIPNDSVYFKCLNPQIDYSKNSMKILLELDTNENFNSSLKQTFFTTSFSGVYCSFISQLPVTDSNVLYYWRTTAVINGDTGSRSAIRTFRCNPSLINQFDVKSNLTDTTVALKKDRKNQFKISDFTNTIFNNGITVGNIQSNVRAYSFGENPWDPSFITVKSVNLHLLKRMGFYFVKINKTNGTIISHKHFFFTSPTSSDSLFNYLNTFDTTHILAAVKFAVPLGVTSNLNGSTRLKIKEFGSTLIDNVNANDWSRWSLVSYKGNPNPVYAEVHSVSGWSAADCNLFPEFQSASGQVTNVFGPAQSWKNFNWEQILFPKTDLKFDVFGIKKSNQETLLYNDLTNQNFYNLDTINAFTYPYLKFVAKLSIDTSVLEQPDIVYNGIPSPIYKGMSLKLTPPSELVIDYNSVIKSDSIMVAGDSIGISLNYYNVGYKNCYGTVRSLYLFRGSEKVIVSQDTNYSTLKIDSSVNIKKYFTITNAMYPIRRNNELITLYYEVSPLGEQNDYYDYNNRIPINVVLISKNVLGQFEAFADGIKLNGGEYIKPQPELTFKYNAGAPNFFRLDDSTLFRIKINDVIYSSGNGMNVNLSKQNVKTGNSEKNESDREKKGVQTLQTVTIYPNLINGLNTIKLLYRNDTYLNFDTIKYVVNVSGELGFLDINNFPNPFKDNTSFLFTISGTSAPNCKIKIYTVAGRLIKTINTIANIGYNQIFWDGRDEDGDALANGVYFYKIIIEGSSRIESSVQKLVVLK